MILISWQKPFFLVFAINLAVERPEFLTKTCFILDFATNCSEKRLELLAKTFFFWGGVVAIDSSGKRPEFMAKIVLFWSAGMVAACWNLVRTECGPLVQKVADLWAKQYAFNSG